MAAAMLGTAFIVLDEYQRAKDWASYLRTFGLCAIMYGYEDDESLRAILVRIAKAVNNCQRTYEGDRDVLISFKQEINEWYIKFSDYSSQSSSSSPERDKLVELMDSVLENIKAFADWHHPHKDAMVDLHEDLKEQIMFGKNFIRFTTLLGIEERHLRQLFTRINAVAVNVAHCCYMSHFVIYDEKDEKKDESSGEEDEESLEKEGEEDEESIQKEDEVEFNLSGLQRLYETCVQILAESKSSRLSAGTETLEMDRQILKDFFDSLVSNLWEILKSSNPPIFSTKDQLQVLYEGLRSLRTILKKQSENVDENMWDRIGIVVYDAGLVICSVSLNAIEDGLATEMDLMLFDLLEKIKLIRANVAEESPEGSRFNYPKVGELGFINYLRENLKDLTNIKVGSTSLAKHQIQTIQEEFFGSFWEKIVELHNKKDVLQSIWNRVVELAYRVEFLADSLATGDIPEFSPMSFDSITEDLKTIKLDASNILDREGLDIKVEKVTKWSNHLPLEKSKSIIKGDKDIVGFVDEAKTIMERLTGGDQKSQIVAIVGMPGLGKTTLAEKVYNNYNITLHFHIRAWCCISQVYDKKNLLIEILNCIASKRSNNYSDMSEEDLALQLYRSLKRKKYLIVLDDVWSIDAWYSLEPSFPDDRYGSRIILTSRHVDVAKLDEKPHFLRALNNEESLELLKTKLFPNEDQWPPTLSELGMQIVKRCKGLPLTIVILTGVLATMRQDDWQEVVEDLSLSTVSSTEQCKNTLELSYRHLPDKLKPCLLYFGAFPEDQDLTTKKLTCLWIAEGFVQQTKSKSLEDKAKGYLMKLIQRSLVTVSKRSSTGKIKTCRIHDLLHKFCMEKAKEGNFFHLLHGYEELSSFNEPHNLRRLCIHSEAEHFKKSRLFCPRVRCLLFINRRYSLRYWFNLSLIVHIFKLLRVLDLSQIYLGSNFSSEIELLVQLRYLAAKGNFNSIPSFIASLTNLETLIVYIASFDGEVELPRSIWKLKKLRHLNIKKTSDKWFGFRLPYDDNSVKLCNLDTFSMLSVSWENLEKISKKLPNIRRLKVQLLKHGACTGKGNKILVLDHLSTLESLTIRPRRYWMSSQIEFCFPLSLKKLTLSDFSFPWCNISAIGNLPNLEALKLLSCAFKGDMWNLEEAWQLPKVRFLKLANLKIVKWTAFESQDHLPSLEKLELESCYYLKELPSCLENNASLQMIVVSGCSAAARSVKKIKEEQYNAGNPELKVISYRWKDDMDSSTFENGIECWNW